MLSYPMAKACFTFIRPLLGVLLCAAAAAVSVALFGRRPGSAWLPLVFLAVVFAIAVRVGALVGVVGTLAGILVFAYLLFPPLGRLAVEDAGARTNLGWMLLGGVVISFLLAPGQQPRHRH